MKTTSQSTVYSLLDNAVPAPSTSGEMYFVHTISDTPNIPLETLAPIKYLFSGFTRLIKGFGTSFKNKRQLVTILVMLFLWLVLTVLPALGLSNNVITYLSFFTAAQNGASNDLFSFLGGTIGKGIFAYFIFSLLMPLLSGKKPNLGMGKGFKKIFTSISIKNLSSLAILSFGLGIAFVSFKFMTGNASFQNAIVGIAAFFLLIRSISNEAGFLRGFITSIINKYFKNLSGNITIVNKHISSITIGFAIAVALSAAGFGFAFTLLGNLLIVVSIVIAIITKKRGVKAI